MQLPRRPHLRPAAGLEVGVDGEAPELGQARVEPLPAPAAGVEGRLEVGGGLPEVEARLAAALEVELAVHAGGGERPDQAAAQVYRPMQVRVAAGGAVVGHGGEEVGLRGAKTAAFSIDPHVGIAVDVTHATDCPGIDKRQQGEIKVAKGPVIFRGPNMSPIVVERLIELVRGLETTDETLAALEEVGRRMGKETVVVNESPGFVTTRINVLLGNEAFRMLQEGVASADDIDRALKLGLNHPMGPFELVDLVGLDVRLSILEHLHATLGELYRPSPLLTRYVRAGRLGRKVGRGVYDYDSRGKRQT